MASPGRPRGEIAGTRAHPLDESGRRIRIPEQKPPPSPPTSRQHPARANSIRSRCRSHLDLRGAVEALDVVPDLRQDRFGFGDDRLVVTVQTLAGPGGHRRDHVAPLVHRPDPAIGELRDCRGIEQHSAGVEKRDRIARGDHFPVEADPCDAASSGSFPAPAPRRYPGSAQGPDTRPASTAPASSSRLRHTPATGLGCQSISAARLTTSPPPADDFLVTRPQAGPLRVGQQALVARCVRHGCGANRAGGFARTLSGRRAGRRRGDRRRFRAGRRLLCPRSGERDNPRPQLLKPGVAR